MRPTTPATDQLRIRCPNLVCRKVLAVPASSRGKNVRCKNCGAKIRVPERPAANNNGHPAAAPKPDASTPGAPPAQAA